MSAPLEPQPAASPHGRPSPSFSTLVNTPDPVAALETRAEPTKRAIALRFVDPSSDWPALAEARLRAFDGSVLDNRLSPIGRRPPLAERVAAEARLAELDARFPTPGVIHLCATLDGVPAGLASFQHRPDRRANSGEPTEEDLEAAETRRAAKAGAKGVQDRAYEQTLDSDFSMRFKAALERSRTTWAEGRAYWLLSMLCVNPEYQGLGIARSLLAWGTAQADLRGLPMLLEASAVAQPLYASFGFEVVSTVSWSASDGAVFSMPVMARAPRSRPAGLAKPLPYIPRPEVILSPVTPDDWADIGRIKILSLGAEGKLFNNCYPTDRQLPLATRIANHVRKEALNARFPTCPTSYVKASVAGRTVGFALWQTPLDRTSTLGRLSREEALRVNETAALRDAAKTDADRQADKAFDAVFYGRWTAAADAKRIEAFEGKPHWFLETLGVQPDFQGYGIGRKLVEDGMKRADAAGLPCWLESSRRGRPLYDRLGFVSLGDIAVETRDGTVLLLPGMIRLAPSAGTNNVVLSFVDPEVDREPLVRVRQLAFERSDMIEHMFHAETRPTLQDRIDGSIRREVRLEPFVTAETVRVKASIGGVPVGLAYWLAPVDRTATDGDPLPDEVAREAAQEAALAAAKTDVDRAYEAMSNTSFISAVGRAFEDSRKRLFAGRRHWYLEMCAVHPDHQGKGIGKALLDWGLAQADRDMVPAYLEASHEGLTLYASRGFEVVGQLDLSEGVIHPAMVRQPRPLPEGFCMPAPCL